MFKLKTDDLVLVTAGKDKGKQGKITKIFPREHRVQVEGVNLYRKHQRATANQAAQTITLTRPLPTANIALICPQCQQPTRVQFKVNPSQPKLRLCAKCQQPLDRQPKT